MENSEWEVCLQLALRLRITNATSRVKNSYRFSKITMTHEIMYYSWYLNKYLEKIKRNIAFIYNISKRMSHTLISNYYR